MTTLALFVYMVAVLGASLRWPMLAGFAYLWLSVSHPQTGNGGFFAWQWSLITIAVFILSYIAHPNKHFSLKSNIYVCAILFFVWTTITTAVGLAPIVGWSVWWDFARMLLAVLAIGGAISQRQDLNFAVLAIVAGVGSVIASGVAQVVLSGGTSHVLGIPGSDFGSNNDVARLFGVSGLPFVLFLSFHAQNALLRKICRFAVWGCVLAIIGTYSRGAFVALVATFAYWGLISRRRSMFVVQGIVLILVVSVVLSTGASNAFLARMSSIQDYEQDKSFQGREFAWDFAKDMAARRPLTGGGFGAFRLDYNAGNVDGRGPWKDAHSIYFEVLGEHGYVGLVLYLLLLGGTFFKAIAITRRCKGHPELYWERDLAIAAQLSLVFHLAGGITISTTYMQYMFFTILIVASLDKITRAATVKAPLAYTPFESAVDDGLLEGALPTVRAHRLEGPPGNRVSLP